MTNFKFHYTFVKTIENQQEQIFWTLQNIKSFKLARKIKEN